MGIIDIHEKTERHRDNHRRGRIPVHDQRNATTAIRRRLN